MTTTDEIRIAKGALEEGRLAIANGVSGLVIVGDADPEDLCRVRHSGAVPDLDALDGVLRMKYPGIAAWPRNKGPITVGLNPDIPWAIDIDGGAEDTRLHAGGFQLSSFKVRGAKGLTIELGQPVGTIPIELGKGVDKLSVSRPAGAALRLEVKGGASNVRLEHQEMGAVGGPLKWETADFEAASDRFHVLVDGGASDVTLSVAG